MPLSSDPNDLIPFHLDTDFDKPASNRPEFSLRFLTEAEHRKVRRLVKSAHEESDEEKAGQALAEAIAIGLASVKHVQFRGVDVNASDKPDGYLTTGELWELAYAVMSKPTLTEAERKKSLPSRDFVPARGAASAEAANAPTSLA